MLVEKSEKFHMIIRSIKLMAAMYVSKITTDEFVISFDDIASGAI